LRIISANIIGVLTLLKSVISMLEVTSFNHAMFWMRLSVLESYRVMMKC